MKSHNWRICTLNILLVIFSLYFIVHFIIISLHAGPVNPISVALKPLTDRYVSPVFYQNWHLFAPNPLTINQKLYVKIKYREQHSSKEVESEWLDVTSPMIEVNNETLFSPYNRIIRISMGYMNGLQIGSADDLTYKIIEKKQEKNEDMTIIDEALSKEQEEAETALYRYATAAAKKYYPDSELISVQITTSKTKAVPYSQRKEDNYDMEEVLTAYEWKEVTKDVVKLP